MFKKDEKEGAFHWRDININKDLISLESKMLVRIVNCINGNIKNPFMKHQKIYFKINQRNSKIFY